MKRRIFLAPLRPGVAYAAAHGHWCGHHARIMRDLPGLCGYVQHRPLPGWWPHVGYLACGETWFEDAEAERAAWASDHYREVVAPDERRMFAMADAWNAEVIGADELGAGAAGRVAAIAFGRGDAPSADALADLSVVRLRLTRPAPGCSDAVALVAAAEDPGQADHLARRLGGLAFAAERAAIVTPVS